MTFRAIAISAVATTILIGRWEGNICNDQFSLMRAIIWRIIATININVVLILDVDLILILDDGSVMMVVICMQKVSICAIVRVKSVVGIYRICIVGLNILTNWLLCGLMIMRSVIKELCWFWGHPWRKAKIKIDFSRIINNSWRIITAENKTRLLLYFNLLTGH